MNTNMNKKDEKNENDREVDVDELEAMRHSASHIMAQAVLKKFPSAKLGIGPARENGLRRR